MQEQKIRRNMKNKQERADITVTLDCPEQGFEHEDTYEGVLVIGVDEENMQTIMGGMFNELKLMRLADQLLTETIPMIIDQLGPSGKALWLVKKALEAKEGLRERECEKKPSDSMESVLWDILKKL